ncbi:MAG: hypothetical protein KA746_10645 [Pyrinomonadaceae bacterium]|nr:hypothetical protein [Pyrinomonadaceae bacterium]MBP6212250.1 hypothetical protein [Pyrinomonadaceae bacterium]
MNDELVTANAAVVSKLLVIAPYSAHGPTRLSSGVSTGEISPTLSSIAKTAAKNCRRFAAHASHLSQNPSDQVAKRAFTSAFFVASGAKRLRAFRAGILRSTVNN